MIRIWTVALGLMLVSTAQAAQPPSCQGLLSNPGVYAKVKDAVTYAILFNRGSEPSPDKVFSDLALEDGSIWLERESTLYSQPPETSGLKSIALRCETRLLLAILT
jgi:hypothetical protein